MPEPSRREAARRAMRMRRAANDVARLPPSPAAAPAAYAELHCITHFSFQRGASSPEELVHRAHALGYRALAITDECSVSGVVQAWQALSGPSAGQSTDVEGQRMPLQLLCGSEFRFAGQGVLVALARDLQGWGDLCQFISACRGAAPKGEYRLPPLADALAALGRCECLWAPQRVAATAQVPPLLPDGRGGSFGLTLLAELHSGLDDALWLQKLQELSVASGWPLAAAGDVHMHVRRAKRLQDVMTAIRLKRPVADCGFGLQASGERHLRPLARLVQVYPPALLSETLAVAARCRFRLEEVRYNYPQEAVLPGLTPTQTLTRFTQDGAAWRFPGGVPAHIQAFIARELALIAECRYEMFFLTVHDIVREARRRGILCQGRSSAANSVVCYCLGITEADPRFSSPLLERFISRARRSEPPDIDVDFEHERREEIIQYIYDKYGRGRAALAASVITYRTRSALRDAGMALGVDARLVDVVAREHRGFVRDDGAAGVLEKASRMDATVSPALVQLWLELAQQLRGRPRHLSQHVGGFVLTQMPLVRLVPVEPAAMAGRQVIQWDKDDLEALGWLKVDILALGMLSAIRRCLDLASGWRGHTITRADITPEDPATYAMIRRADTVGVFQIESRAQMSMLPRLRPAVFYDLVVQVAIVRPGPVTGGMVHPYLRARERRRQGLPIVHERARGEPADAPPRLAQALERTLGIPIFQEQVMQLSMLAAGFTPEEADRLRRAMAAWKRKGGLEPFRDKLLGGMRARGYRREFAERLFEQIQGFGEYGFPESHAYSFALLVYESAWLKCHEPQAYLAALLNSRPMGFYAPAQLVQDARRHGVVVLPPDVGASDWDCTLEKPRRGTGEDAAAAVRPVVRLGLRLVRGLARQAALRMVAARAQRPFASVQDLACRAGLDAAALGQLAAADALASLAGHRRQQVWQGLAVKKTSVLLKDAAFIESELPFIPAPEGEAIVHDYAALGLTLRRHPLALLRPRLEGLRLSTARQLDGMPHGRQVRACGLVIGRQRPATARGTIFATLEDETGQVNVIVWKSVYADAAQRGALLHARLLAVVGEWQRDRDGGGRVCHLIARHLRDLTPLLGRLAESATSRDFH